YRLAADPPRARHRLLDILAEPVRANGLRIEDGRMVINLLPPLTVTKGSVVSWLVHEHHLSAIVYLGDDTTDAHAFQELNSLRDAGRVRTLGIAVVGPETPAGVRELADATLPSVAAVADLLADVAGRLTTRATRLADDEVGPSAGRAP
ncbi:MAG TPA: trehalose-phosphatase, partial [Chloroflexota bacterium]